MFAPEPIPLFLFSETQKFSEPFASWIGGNGLDETVAALRAFALIDRESISDERDAAITTDCIRLHRLVRQVAAARCPSNQVENERRILIAVMAAVYPINVFSDPKSWPRARRLDALAMGLVNGDEPLPLGSESHVSHLLDRLASYRQGPLAADALAQPLFERALAIDETTKGADHLDTAASLNNLALSLRNQGDATLARTLSERALKIIEKAKGPDHTLTAIMINSLALAVQDLRDFATARTLFERALAIHEKALGEEHPSTATSLNNLGILLVHQKDIDAARPLFERALAIDEKVLGHDDPGTAIDRLNLGDVLQSQGDLESALLHYEYALATLEKAMGSAHPTTKKALNRTIDLLTRLGRTDEVVILRAQFA